ncbi:cell death regulator Aven [Spea bombifrons]|uniref:cell death regulator Aven n=1 Tax=Spea bombifrons TaxID=233779 RepID=UPI00234B971F|nr:cell death regulator Aven [Spea bombifrons]
MERGRGRYRRGGGGGGGGGRRRPGGDRRAGPDRETAHLARTHKGAGATPGAPEPERKEGGDGLEPQEENDPSSGFSRRKILSNWDRYEQADKEPESKVLQRGTDYSVLLSSAGDSFTQFRLADEREWEAENPCNKQVLAVFLDSRALLKTLQELPLYIRLNVDGDLVQEEVPQEVPQLKVKNSSSSAPTIASQVAKGASVGSTQEESLPLPNPGKDHRTTTTQDPTLSALDEDLEFLLGLEAPLTAEASSQPTVGAEREKNDLQATPEGPGIALMEVVGSVAEEKQTEMTEEDLEDWLDSMIS